MWYWCSTKAISSGYNIALPETNQNEIELKFANEMHSAINTARKKAGVDGLTLNGNFCAPPYTFRPMVHLDRPVGPCFPEPSHYISVSGVLTS